MSSILATSENDIVFQDGVLLMLSGIDCYAQRMRDNLRFQQGEWELDPEWGTPWLELLVDEDITDTEPFTNLVKSILLADSETEEVLNAETSFDSDTLALTITVKIKSVYGVVDLEDSIILSGG